MKFLAKATLPFLILFCGISAQAATKLDCEPSGFDGTPSITANIENGGLTDVTVTYIFEQGDMEPSNIGTITPEPSGRLTYLLTYDLQNDSTAKETLVLAEDLASFPVGKKFKAIYQDHANALGTVFNTKRDLNCTIR